MLSCCNFKFSNTKELEKHLKEHRFQANLLVLCNFCGQSCKGWEAFQKHYFREHKSNIENSEKKAEEFCNTFHAETGTYIHPPRNNTSFIALENNEQIFDENDENDENTVEGNVKLNLQKISS